MRRLEESLAVCFVPTSVLRLTDPRKLELGTARLLQCHVVAGDFQLINRRGEGRLDFDSILIAEPVSASDVSHEHGAIVRELPNRFAGTSRHPPFPNDLGIPAAGYRAQQNC